MAKFTREEWRKIFRAAVEYCKAHKGEEKFQHCVGKLLREASRSGSIPSELKSYL